MKHICSILGAAIILFAASPLFAEWPDRGLTLVTSVSRTVPWNMEAADIRAEILDSLIPRLSRELGVPVNLIFRPAGSGVLAGNMVAGAKPDGYVFGALGGDAAMSRAIQGFTPYSWSEFAPVAAAWRTMYAMVVRADETAKNLREFSQDHANKKPRLAHTGLTPIAASTLMALNAAESLGFSWELLRVETLDPDYLFRNRADAMILPLGALRSYARRDELKVITVFVKNRNAPCAAGLPNLLDQNIDIALNPPFAFYLPSKVNWRVRSRLALAINQAFQQKGVREAMTDACLEPCWDTMDNSIDNAAAMLNREYNEYEEALGRTAIIEAGK